MVFFFFFFVFCFLLLLSVVVSALELPASIQKIIDYNNQQAAYYLENITYIVAFLAGLLAILSPCTLAIVPMYFSYGLKEKSTWHTFTFFLGFTSIFIALGILASFLGQSILFFQAEHSFLIFLAGLFLILFGVMQIVGKGFSFLPIKVFKAKSLFGVFILGMLFAFAVDGFKLHEKSWIRGKQFHFTFFGKTLEIHSTQLIAGIMLISMGLIFVLFQDTSLFLTINIAGANLKGYALQESLLSSSFVPFIGLALFIAFVFLLGYFLLRKFR